MSQYTTGTAATTAGSPIIQGTGTAWLTSASQGDEFIVADDTVFYTIQSVTSDTELTLTANYPSTLSAQSYAINRDFTTNRGYPLIAPGDAHSADTYSRAMREIDQDMGLGLIFLGSVIDKDLNAAPTSGVSDGDAYIVGAAVASGDDWFGEEDSLATYDSSATGNKWTFTTPVNGNFVFVVDENTMYIYDGSAWVQWTLTTGPDGSYRLLFTSGDLAAGVLTVPHALNQQTVLVTVRKNDDTQFQPDVTFDSNVSLSADFGPTTITGQWEIFVKA